MRKQLARKRSIRTVLIVTFVALIVTNVVLASALSLRNAHKASSQLASELQNQVTLQIQDHLNSYLALPHMINQVNLDNVELGLVDLDDFAALERYVWKQTTRFGAISAITYADERAEYVGTTRDAPGGPISLVVSGLQTGHAMEIYDAGSRGERGRLQQRYPEYDPRPRPWYQAAARRGAATWTPVFVWTTGAIGTDAVTPVYHADGSLRGVLDVSLTLDGISHYLQELKVAKSGKTFIIERSGLIVASSEPELPYVKEGAVVRRLSAVESQVPLIRAAAQALLAEVGSFAAVDASRQISFADQGGQFVQVTPFRDPYGLDWLIVVVVPQEDLLGEIRDNSQSTLLLIGMALLMGIGAAILTAGWMARPVRRLNQSAKALALGRWQEPVPGHYLREIDELAGSFNLMATQLQESFESLRRNERRLRETLQAARMGTWEWEAASDRLSCSDLMPPLLGLAAGAPASSFDDYFVHVPEADRVRMRALLLECVEGRCDDLVIEHQVSWPDGSVHWLENKGRAAGGAEGPAPLVRGILADITEQKLLQQQLVQSQKMEAIGRLAGGIAHDFNNILTYMLGTCSLMLLDLPQDDPWRADVVGLEDAVTSAAQLTHQLLAFSRQQVLVPQTFDLNHVVREMSHLLGRLIGEDVTLVVQLDPAPTYVRADPGQLEQVILNLAVNARDAMPVGGTLMIETANVLFDEANDQEGPGGAPYVRLLVCDTGSGIDAALQARIFDPFFTTKEPGKGTGLGLSTVHGIVTQSGGQILLESAVGSGTTFKIYLPHNAAPQPDPAAAPPRPPSDVKRTILLVEDAAAVRALTSRVLRQAGYTVLEAGSGPAALEVLEAHGAVDLLLTDIIMPGGMSGFELARQLRLRLANVPVLFISGYAEPGEEALEAEIDLLTKPFAPEELLARVARSISGV